MQSKDACKEESGLKSLWKMKPLGPCRKTVALSWHPWMSSVTRGTQQHRTRHAPDALGGRAGAGRDMPPWRSTPGSPGAAGGPPLAAVR